MLYALPSVITGTTLDNYANDGVCKRLRLLYSHKKRQANIINIILVGVEYE